MKMGALYDAAAFLALFSLIGLLGCQDQGTRYSFQDTAPGAYGQTTESTYDALLKRYVDSSNLIRYDLWHKSDSDLARLKSVLDDIAKADESSMSDEQRKAFYINAYNAMTLDLILSHYEETKGGESSPYPGSRSIRNISNLDTRVWDSFQWLVSGKSRTLNEIENKILRPMGDARVHFAIVCASMGCPPLHPNAFTETNLNATLDELASAFVNSGRNTTFDAASATLRTSQILSWFKSDFAKSFGSLEGFFKKYVKVISPQDLEKLKITFTEYDWTLNQSTVHPSIGSGTERGLN